MVHTLPDYTTKYKTARVFGNLDHAELAVRLGSIISFDRRGNIYALDDFEACTLGWETGATGTGADVSLSTSQHRSGSQSVKLLTGNISGNYAMIYKHYPQPPNTKIGLEISFTTNEPSTKQFIRGEIFDGTTKRIFGLNYDTVNKKLQIIGTSGGWEDLDTNISTYHPPYMFHTMKIVADLSTNMQTRAFFDRLQYDLSSHSIYSTSNSTAPNIRVAIYNETGSNSQAENYIDDFILTYDEP